MIVFFSNVLLLLWYLKKCATYGNLLCISNQPRLIHHTLVQIVSILRPFILHKTNLVLHQIIVIDLREPTWTLHMKNGSPRLLLKIEFPVQKLEEQ